MYLTLMITFSFNIMNQICFSCNFTAESNSCVQIKAQTLWYAIIESQIETGTPYMLYKDACNSKSNQQNLGTIKCSNLCTEIVEYSAPDEVNTYSANCKDSSLEISVNG